MRIIGIVLGTIGILAVIWPLHCLAVLVKIGLVKLPEEDASAGELMQVLYETHRLFTIGPIALIIIGSALFAAGHFSASRATVNKLQLDAERMRRKAIRARRSRQ